LKKSISPLDFSLFKKAAGVWKKGLLLFGKKSGLEKTKLLTTLKAEHEKPIAGNPPPTLNNNLTTQKCLKPLKMMTI